MILFVRIDTDPPLAFYRDIRALRYAAGVAYRRLVSVGTIRRPLQVGGGGENASCAITLDNGDGRLTGLFATPPFRRRVAIEDISSGASVRLFTGTVSRISLGSEIILELEA
jgi:hypothetical protein